MLIEIFLEFLVREIDIELLESIHREILESENVQDADETKRLVSVDTRIDFLENPTKRCRIQRHRHGIARISGLNKINKNK